MSQTQFRIIGVMSGTSLDGIDISDAIYIQNGDTWSFKLLNAETIEYSDEMLQSLQKATSLTALDLIQLDKSLGIFFGETINNFIDKYRIPKSEINCIASHGHTVYHQPSRGITVQIGCGSYISTITHLKVINDFRKKDVALGGQGAPLVPIGDSLLFGSRAASYLNIGGFANISFKNKDGKVIAFDICPANIAINLYMRNLGHSFDKNGGIASSYPYNEELLTQLNNLALYQLKKPHSLGSEWLESNFLPLIDHYSILIEEKISTLTEHAAIQIARVLNSNDLKSVYVTGGGSKNTHLINRIKHHYFGEIIIPEPAIVDFKESIVFGFLGALNLLNIPNCLSSVTGATKDTVGGSIHLP